MSGTFDRNGRIDTGRGIIATCIGKKRSGKSIMGLLLFRAYPGDRLVLDVAGDDGPIGDDVHNIRGTVDDLPRRWPEHLRENKKPMTLRYVPDAGSQTFLEDMDAFVALAMTHGDCCLLVHEAGRLAPVHKTGPNTARLLMHNRHQRVTAIFCMPRSQGVDTLILSQADLVYTFEVPNPADRKRIAETIGWNPADFDDAVHDLGPHEYLRFDSNELKPQEGNDDNRLLHFPALPADVVVDLQRWADGQRRVEP